MTTTVEAALQLLQNYCEQNEWAGYEPYDALNSRILTALQLVRVRSFRLLATQALKRSPINIRRLLLIEKKQNPKALGIFLSAFIKLAGAGDPGPAGKITDLIDSLLALRSPAHQEWCWGYSFPWQTRTVLVPRWAPNLVCTSFAAAALLDAYELNGNPRLLEIAASSAEYLLNNLYWSNGKGVCGFGYPLPSVRNQVHNANLLAAELLFRVHMHTGEARFLGPALQATRYTVAQQHPDGSWDYGEARSQQWIDNFHTGFNLCSLHSISKTIRTDEFDRAIRRGLSFYRDCFVLADGRVAYYHNRCYPIDSHCIAQTVITLHALKEIDPDNLRLASSVLKWAMDHMWDDRGFFYYRVLRSCTIRTSYLRWTQAWMFLALTAAAIEKKAASSALPVAAGRIVVQP